MPLYDMHFLAIIGFIPFNPNSLNIPLIVSVGSPVYSENIVNESLLLYFFLRHLYTAFRISFLSVISTVLQYVFIDCLFKDFRFVLLTPTDRRTLSVLTPSFKSFSRSMKSISGICPRAFTGYTLYEREIRRKDFYILEINNFS